MNALFGASKTQYITNITKLGRARILINITPIVFGSKKKVIYTQEGLRVSKLRNKFHFWVNYSFNLKAHGRSVLKSLYGIITDNIFPYGENQWDFYLTLAQMTLISMYKF